MSDTQVIARGISWNVSEHPGRRGEYGFEDSNLRTQIAERVQADVVKSKEMSGVLILNGFSVEWRRGDTR